MKRPKLVSNIALDLIDKNGDRFFSYQLCERSESNRLISIAHLSIMNGQVVSLSTVPAYVTRKYAIVKLARLHMAKSKPFDYRK